MKPEEAFRDALEARELPDGRWLSLWPMAFGNTRLCINVPEESLMFFADFYCYHDTARGLHAVRTWDGEGDPEGWVRHIGTHRRRSYNPDGSVAGEWVAP